MFDNFNLLSYSCSNSISNLFNLLKKSEVYESTMGDGDEN